jgi:hypothetical protein
MGEGMNGGRLPDELIARLRARAADPKRRADVIVSAFDRNVRTLDLGSLMSQLGSVAGLLRQTVDANREGRVDPAGHARALDIRREMTTPAQPNLPGPATDAQLAAVEARLGFGLPPALRQALMEVADGGFGPGAGLFGADEILAQYERLVREGPEVWGHAWPVGLLPVVDRDPGVDCVEAGTGRVVGWDPEELTERSSDRVWARSFQEIAPSVEAWLAEWVGSKTWDEQVAERTQASMLQEARKARERIGAMTVEERRAMGLPDVGWEKVVWGGLGWEDD